MKEAGLIIEDVLLHEAVDIARLVVVKGSVEDLSFFDDGLVIEVLRVQTPLVSH